MKLKLILLFTAISFFGYSQKKCRIQYSSNSFSFEKHIGNKLQGQIDYLNHYCKFTVRTKDLTGYTKVFPDDVLRLKLTSSANYSTAVSSTLTVGTRTDTYTVTTGAEPYVSTGNKPLKGSDGKVLKDSTGKVIKPK
jgi:hypothetical protein